MHKKARFVKLSLILLMTKVVALVALAWLAGAASAEYDALLDNGQLTACLNDCSFHGTCIHETCHCDVGYASDDCSYPIMAFVDFGIRGIDPPSGLALGGTRVFLTGFTLVAGMVCRFEPLSNVSAPRLVHAQLHDPELISCLAPPSAFLRSTADELVERVPPAPPPLRKAVRLEDFEVLPPPPPTYFVTDATRPALHTPPLAYRLELALHPPHFTNNGMRFEQWDAALFSVTPMGGPLGGNTSVLLRGRGFRRRGDSGGRSGALPPQCMFGTARVPATLLSGALLRCSSPPAQTAGETTLSVSFDSSADVPRDFTQAAPPLTLLPAITPLTRTFSPSLSYPPPRPKHTAPFPHYPRFCPRPPPPPMCARSVPTDIRPPAPSTHTPATSRPHAPRLASRAAAAPLRLLFAARERAPPITWRRARARLCAAR